MRKHSGMLLPMMALIACSGKKIPVDTQFRKAVPVRQGLSVEITNVDISNYPLITMRGSVKDSADNPVINLAPPHADPDDWEEIWVPQVQQHPKFGEKKIEDFKVVEKQFERIDSNRLAFLNKKKENLELQIAKLKQKIGLDQLKRRPTKTSLVLVIDVSSSMSAGPLLKARKAAMKLITALKAEVAIIAFSDRVAKLTGFTRSEKMLTAAIQQLQAGGATCLYNALYSAIDLLLSKSGEKQILVITDGQTSRDRYTLQQIINFANSGDVSLAARTEQHTQLFTIGLGYSGSDLKTLAEKTSGVYYYASSPDDLIDVFSDYVGYPLDLAQDLKSLEDQLQDVEKTIEQLHTSLIKDSRFDISFTSGFPEDGMHITVVFRVGDQTVRQLIQLPLSAIEFVVSGYIIDDITTQPIVGATITVNSQATNETSTTQTDSDGYFELGLPKNDDKYSIFAYSDDHFISAEEQWLAQSDDYYVSIKINLEEAKPGATAEIRTVHYENNEFLFEPSSFSDLMVMGKYLAMHPEYKFEIGGHTDSYGNDSYNEWLSEKRAAAIADFFVGLGVPEENIVVKGYGESDMLVEDTSEENRYMNRRIEIKLISV